MAIPASVDEVTPGWLSEVTGFDVRDASIEQIGVGVGVSSALYRVNLSGGPECPESVVVKLPALDEAAVFTSTVLRMYLREAAFFSELAGQAPIRVPICHHAAVDEESHFALVLEDLGDLRAVDQITGMSVDDAQRAVDGLAAWHATWWGRAEPLAEAGTTVSLGDPIYKAVLPTVFAEGWEKLGAELEIPAAIQEVGPRWSDAMPGMLDRLAVEPTTMIHGDFRADNLFFQPDGSVASVDFQLIGTGRGAYDLAYFLTQSLDDGTASGHEKDLFERWTNGLRAAGVSDADLAECWDDYRVAALFCLVYPVVAWRGMDAGDPRQLDLASTMLRRLERSIAELDLAQLL